MVTEPLLHRIPGATLVPTPVPVIGHAGEAFLQKTVALGLDPTAYLAHPPRPVVMPPVVANGSGLPGAHLPSYWPPQQLQSGSLTSYLPVTTALVAPLSVMSSSLPVVPAVPLMSSSLPLASTVPLIPRTLSTLAPTTAAVYSSVAPSLPSGNSPLLHSPGALAVLPIVSGKIPLPPAPNSSLTRAPMSLNGGGSLKKKGGDAAIVMTPEDEPKKYVVCRFIV